MRKMSLKKAKELSQMKWEIIVKQNGSDVGIEDNPLFENLVNKCGFCERHKRAFDTPDCLNCEISMGLESSGDSFSVSCWNRKHPFSDWGDSGKIEDAQRVLDLVNSVKV